MAGSRLLEVVDDLGNVLGTATREAVHRDGLLHREVHVWFVTPRDAVIFQHRGKNADTHPDLLDVTVGGHVEVDDGVEEAALREIEEETGLRIRAADLRFLRTVRSRTEDPVTQTVNNVLRAVYAYRYAGSLTDLRVEEGKSLGFEAWPRQRLFQLSEAERRRFIPSIFAPDTLEIFRALSRVSRG